jgi:hypothetical protein
MDKDKKRMLPEYGETNRTVYKCGIDDCEWLKKDLQLWEALREYRLHFNTDHHKASFATASLIITGVSGNQP